MRLSKAPSDNHQCVTWGLRGGLCALLWLTMSPLAAQNPMAPTGRVFPEETRDLSGQPPVLPDYEAPEKPQVLELPPVDELLGPPDRLSSGVQVFVKGYRFTGSTVFTQSQLAEVAAPYTNRPVSSEELQELRRRLTLLYVERGYINSGVVLPDQAVTDGIIRFRVIEGRLEAVRVTGNRRLSSDYVSTRLTTGEEKPLNVNDLQERLHILLQDPLIEQVNARLGPGRQPGEAVLDIQVQEARPYQLSAGIDNQISPSVGSWRYVLAASHDNLTGAGDGISAKFARGRELNDYRLAYAAPLNRFDTMLGISFEKTNSTIIEVPFDELDIESNARTFEFSITHPLYRTAHRQLTIGATLAVRHSKTFLLGEPFSFSPGVRDGVADISALRFTQDWLDRSVDQVIALRSTFSFGLDAFDSTINGDDTPDSDFLAWLGQFQWAKRVGKGQVLFRTYGQLARDSLLPLEQFSIGGVDTVRGYRENTLVRDNGYVISLEYRHPLFRGHPRYGTLEFAPFVDYGRGWNTDTPTPPVTNIASVGAGLRWQPSTRVYAQVYWGHALRNVETSDHDIQDDGIHFLVSVNAF